MVVALNNLNVHEKILAISSWSLVIRSTVLSFLYYVSKVPKNDLIGDPIPCGHALGISALAPSVPTPSSPLRATARTTPQNTPGATPLRVPLICAQS